MEESLCFGDGDVVDGGVAFAHQTIVVKSPVLVAVGAEPCAAFALVLVDEAHRDATLRMRPEFLDQPIVPLVRPLLTQKLFNFLPKMTRIGITRLSAFEELAAVAPLRVLAVGERDCVWVATWATVVSR